MAVIKKYTKRSVKRTKITKRKKISNKRKKTQKGSGSGSVKKRRPWFRFRRRTEMKANQTQPPPGQNKQRLLAEYLGQMRTVSTYHPLQGSRDMVQLSSKGTLPFYDGGLPKKMFYYGKRDDQRFVVKRDLEQKLLKNEDARLYKTQNGTVHLGSTEIRDNLKRRLVEKTKEGMSIRKSKDGSKYIFRYTFPDGKTLTAKLDKKQGEGDKIKQQVAEAFAEKIMYAQSANSSTA